MDHVVPLQLGGVSKSDNYLPICVECNRLRWGYRPEVLRLMIRFGIYAKQQIRHNTPLGELLVQLATGHSSRAASALADKAVKEAKRRAKAGSRRRTMS